MEDVLSMLNIEMSVVDEGGKVIIDDRHDASYIWRGRWWR